MNNSLELPVQDLFPSPLYYVFRDSNIDITESEEIKNIIEEGMEQFDGREGPEPWAHREGIQNSTSRNSYLFNDKLHKLKEFCEKHIKIYIDNVISPKGDVKFYITQSWLKMTKPGEEHRKHNHPNSIISGVYYIKTTVNDVIKFYDPNSVTKQAIKFSQKEAHIWNATSWLFPVTNNKLILFPAWLEHSVPINPQATTDRISLAFNVFAKGIVGEEYDLTRSFL